MLGTRFTFFMGSGAANPDGIAHALITDLGGGMFLVGFEDLFGGGDCDFDDNIFVFSSGITDAELVKVLTSGPDVDNDGEIDLVVAVGTGSSAEYDFTIFYNDDQRVLIVDTVPAEWTVLSANQSSGTVDVFPTGKSNPAKSATRIRWDTDQLSSLNVIAETRPSPGSNGKFRPTSCGLLRLNDGAEAFEVDQVTGEPIRVLGPTPPIRLIAVGDQGLPADYPRDGSGDFDQDGLD